MLRPGSAIKRKQKPLPSQIAAKQVRTSIYWVKPPLARGEQTARRARIPQEARLLGGPDYPWLWQEVLS